MNKVEERSRMIPDINFILTHTCIPAHICMQVCAHTHTHKQIYMLTNMHTTYTQKWKEFAFLIYTKYFWNIGLYKQSMFKCPWKIVLTHFNCKI